MPNRTCLYCGKPLEPGTFCPCRIRSFSHVPEPQSESGVKALCIAALVLIIFGCVVWIHSLRSRSVSPPTVHLDSKEPPVVAVDVPQRHPNIEQSETEFVAVNPRTTRPPYPVPEPVRPVKPPLAVEEPLALAVPQSGNAVYKKALPSVVVIKGFRKGTFVGLGSGFITNPNKRIITNAHVVVQCDEVEIKSHRGITAHIATAFAVDENHDLALLPLPDALEDSPPLSLAAAIPQPGDDVYALGAPQGLTFSFTKGVVAQIRTFPKFGQVIQHDALIDHGNSGGPLLNGAGEVVGVNSFGFKMSGCSESMKFAVAYIEIQAVVCEAEPKPLSAFPGYKRYAAVQRQLEEAERQVAREQEQAQRAEQTRQSQQVDAIKKQLDNNARIRAEQEEAVRAEQEQRQAALDEARRAETAWRAEWRRLKKGLGREFVKKHIGKPNRIEYLDLETWYFGTGAVYFDRGWIVGWDEPDWRFR